VVTLRADWDGLSPVIHCIKRRYDRIGANSAGCRMTVRIARRRKLYRSIQRRCIVVEISHKIVEVITRLPGMPVASGLIGNSAVLKIWHRGIYEIRKLTNLIAVRPKLGNRVDSHLGIALA